MEEMTGFLYFFIITIIIIVFLCYVALAIFLSKFSKKVYGESSVMSWIPFANIYLLGKLTFNKDAGYGLLALLLLSGTITLTFDKTTFTLSLPNAMQVALGAIFAGTLVVTIIFGLKKYGKLYHTDNKEKDDTEIETLEEIEKENDNFFNN